MDSIRCIRGAEGPLESSKRSSFLSGPNQTTMLFVRAAKRADLQERRDWTQSLSTPGNQHWRRRARRAVNLPGNAHHASGDCSMSVRNHPDFAAARGRRGGDKNPEICDEHIRPAKFHINRLIESGWIKDRRHVVRWVRYEVAHRSGAPLNARHLVAN